MTSQEPAVFWKDPRAWIAMLAMIGTLGNFIWSLRYQSIQNSRWETLNAPNPQIKDVNLVSYGVFTSEEIKQKKWGYNQKFYAKPGSLSEIVMYHILIAKDSAGQIIENINPVFTIPDLILELKRINFERQVFVFKKFNPRFTFENMGKTEAKNLLINIEAKLPDANWVNVSPQNARINMAANQSSSTDFILMIPVKEEIPKIIECRVTFEFQGVEGKYFKKIIETKWESSNNQWTYK